MVTSHREILKSSSIVGGAQAINYVVGLLRTKAVALLLGPSGVGLVGLYVSAIGLVGTFAQFGINESGVREVAAAAGTNNAERIAATAKTLRRICWASGIFGWVLTVALAWPLAKWTFGSPEHAWAIAILGSAVLLDLVSGGQRALLQGVRRIGDLARMQIASAIIATVLSVSVYWWLGQNGILPVIILTSLVQLGTSWWFSRRIELAPVQQTWAETWRNSAGLVQLGSAFMYGALLAGAVGLAIRALVVRDLGIEAAGIYQAAWALSGMFGAFVLQAMGTDFYPRLTAAASDDLQVTKLVNEQMEVGMLLALPGVLGAIAFAPWLMSLFYSKQFLVGGELLAWFAAGVFVQVITWPMGMIQRAKGSTGWIFASQTHLNLLNLLLVFAGVRFFGLAAAAWAFVVAGAIHGFVVRFIAGRLAQYKTSKECSVILFLSALAILLCGLVRWGMTGVPAMMACGAVVLVSSVLCLRALARATGSDSRLSVLIGKFPGARLLLR